MSLFDSLSTDPLGNVIGNFGIPNVGSAKSNIEPSKLSPINDLKNKIGSNGFAPGKYSVSQQSYPSDLMGNDQYGGNYVMFYINVAVDSKFNPPTGSTEEVPDVPRNLRGSVAGQGATMGQMQAGVVGAAALPGALAGAGAGLAGAVGSKGFFSLQSITGTAKGAAGGALATGGATAIGALAVGEVAATTTRAQKRLKTAIALHMPNQLTIRYGANYSDEETMDAAMGVEIAKALSGNNTNADASGSSLAKSAVASQALQKGGAAAAYGSAATGLAANPKREQVFKGVDFRTFTFEYQFFPRDENEADNVLEIIRLFKFHMHPEFKGPGQFIYIYPSEFDISYYSNGQENLNLHKHTSCVLTELSVNYTPNGLFTAYDSSSPGMPTQINIQMTFRELQLLDKDLINQGL
jgi:hypothetical protein